MTEQELKECIAEVRYSDIPKPVKKKIMNVLYERLLEKTILLQEKQMK